MVFRWKKITGEVEVRRSIKGKGHTDLLVDANKPFQLKYIYSTEMVQLSVIMVSGMKKEFLSIFEIDELTVLLLVPVVFNKDYTGCH